MKIDAADDVTLRRPQLQVPAEAEVGHDADVRPSVNHLHQRPFLLGIEIRWINNPHVYLVAVRAFEGDFLDLAEPPFGVEGVVEVRDLRGFFLPRPMGKHCRRHIEAGAQENRQPLLARKIDAALGSAAGETFRALGIDADEIDVAISIIVGLEG